MACCLGLAVLTGCGDVAATTGLGGTPFWLDGGASDALQGEIANARAGDSSPSDGDVHDDGHASDGGPASSETVFYAVWSRSRRQNKNPSPFGAEWQESRTTVLGLAQVVWTGSKGQRWLHTCAMHANEVGGAQVTFGSAFLAALPLGPIALQREGKLVSQPEATEWLGMQPGFLGTMPATGQGSAASVFDADSDGHPGVTVDVAVPFLGQHRIFVAQRTTSSWQAEFAPDLSLAVQPSVSFEQATLGASLDLLVTEVVSKPLESGPADEFVWVPVPKDTTCKQLVQQAQGLVGKPWPP